MDADADDDADDDEAGGGGDGSSSDSSDGEKISNKPKTTKNPSAADSSDVEEMISEADDAPTLANVLQQAPVLKAKRQSKRKKMKRKIAKNPVETTPKLCLYAANDVKHDASKYTLVKVVYANSLKKSAIWESFSRTNPPVKDRVACNDCFTIASSNAEVKWLQTNKSVRRTSRLSGHCSVYHPIAGKGVLNADAESHTVPSPST